MAGRDNRLQEVLDGYAEFLRAQELALAKHQGRTTGSIVDI